MNILPDANFFQKTMPQTEKNEYLLEVEHLSMTIERYEKGLNPIRQAVIRDFHLTIRKGEIIAIVGASGSGKSLLADAILGIQPKNAVVEGVLKYNNEPLSDKKKKELRGKEIMLIPQLTNALDPLMKVEKQVKSFLKIKNKRKLEEIFFQVGLDKKAMKQLPANLSGGMVRRVFAAMALASDAKLIIADEPTNGLDEEAANDMLRLLKMLAEQEKGIIFITHDIEAALKIADKIAVFYAGETVEIVARKHFIRGGAHLRHPYTKALWYALPQNGFQPFYHFQPSTTENSRGCLFAEHCPKVKTVCKERHPDLKTIHGGDKVRCFYA